MAPVNITSIKTASNGVWQGDDPLHFAFPLLIVQTLLILVISRSLSFILKPLRQPNVIAEIVGGILLGPSGLGRNKTFLHNVFPSWSTPILETAASIGLLLFLFLVGLELDMSSIRRSGRRAFAIAAGGITLPFVCGVGVAFVLRSTVEGADEAGYAPFLVFMGVSLSITAFPVLARILAELKILTTPLGETAMAAAAFNDIAAWVLLALAVAISGTGKSPLVSLWVLLSGAGFVGFMVAAVAPAMAWVARRSDEGESELYVAVTIGGVLASGFATDFIGIHSIFGAFVFGLVIPKDGEFAGRMIERIEDLVSGLLLPLYFASSGLKTDVTKIKGIKAWGLLVLVVSTACFGKIMGTVAVAKACRMRLREAATLGVLMNTKGLVELIVLNIGKEKKVLNDEIFAILVLMALFTTFVTTPTVMAIYKPARPGSGARGKRKLVKESPSEEPASGKELRVLACVRSPRDVPSIINLIETIRGGARKSPLKLYIMHLVELTERSSSIAMALRARRNGLPFRNPLRKVDTRDKVLVAFDAYGQLGRVRVRPMTAISAMSTMHEDVCGVADEKKVALVVLPFHKHGKVDAGGDRDGGGRWMENVGPGWRAVNQRVLKGAPCSVAMLVDRRLGGGEQVGPAEVARGVCVVFFGGPDDREALELGARMAEHPGVAVKALRLVEGHDDTGDGGDREGKRFTNKRGGSAISFRPSQHKSPENRYTFSTAPMDANREKDLDEEAIIEFRRRTEGLTAVYEERQHGGDVLEAVLAIGRSREHDLIVVGRGRFPPPMIARLAEESPEHAELGPIGDALASSCNGVQSSVLVIQQHDQIHSDETAVSVVLDCGSTAASHNDASQAV